jgi:hypothetical protein
MIRKAPQVTFRFSVLLLAAVLPGPSRSGESPEGPWRALPLIQDGKVHPDWTQVGWGGFAIDDGTLRTECDPRGMGLLLYRKEKLGNCQIRVVYRTKDAKSNAGVFVRIDDGILKRLDEKPVVERNPDGAPAPGAMEKLEEASEKEKGVWYPVHHGYEVQICEDSDEYHRSGAVYSLARAAPAPGKPLAEWRTMIITLEGNRILVDIDGKRVTSFDPEARDIPQARRWFEPKREPKRPASGFLGLQNHDPGDIVWFKEVSVRPLPAAR